MFSPIFSTNFTNISQSKAKYNVKIRGKNLRKKFVKPGGELNHARVTFLPNCEEIKKISKDNSLWMKDKKHKTFMKKNSKHTFESNCRC